MQLDIFFDKKAQRIDELIEAAAGRLFNFCENPWDRELAIAELENCVCPVLMKKIYDDFSDRVLMQISQWMQES